MERHIWTAAVLLSLLGTSGCGSSSDSTNPEGSPPPATSTETTSDAAAAPEAQSVLPPLTPEQIAAREELRPFSDAPDKAVREFLSAVQVGNDERAGMLLTDMALFKTREKNLIVAPESSPTAQFTVGGVEFVTEDQTGAYVSSTWTDFDHNGQASQNNIVWIAREEDHGWRIAGMAMHLFEGEAPLILNFEDPDDMVRKQELAMEEMARREAEAAEQPAEIAAETNTNTTAENNVAAPEAGTPFQAQAVEAGTATPIQR